MTERVLRALVLTVYFCAAAALLVIGHESSSHTVRVVLFALAFVAVFVFFLTVEAPPK
jgi:hypothetical protein